MMSNGVKNSRASIVDDSEKVLPNGFRRLKPQEKADRNRKVLNLFNEAVSDQVGAQDIFIVEGEVPEFRVKGVLMKVNQFYPWDLDDFNYFLRNVSQQYTKSRDRLDDTVLDTKFYSALMRDNEKKYDYSFMFGKKTFRCHVFSASAANDRREKAAIVIRVIPHNIPKILDLNLPKVVEKIPKFQSGLVLVSGRTNDGKSTTVASIVNAINLDMERRKVIVTVEDPIEFHYKQANAKILQRRVGDNVPSFARATEDILREGVDVAVIGELRGEEEMYNALKLAEMGKLVISTIHADSVAATVDRFVGEFSADIQSNIRSRLVENLLAIVHQNLDIYKGEQYPIASALLISDKEIRDKLRAAPTRDGINKLLEEGDPTWAVTREDAYKELLDRGVIDDGARDLFLSKTRV
ncbi:type IV pilus twitching motility protein PilT [Bacillus subtilis]|uniref:type IV pilus twitching motility protein PilT n=2 Tax=Bacillaceae TaxID=186817 RepID=UPI001CFC0DB5|nr:ATPase, T2SS/T4P/T4SS family [Bacillus subtilis]MCL9628490.1 Flp pilus assembly complex ATPase component TadA [Bacillus subtilis]